MSDWTIRANCIGVPEEIFFPGAGQTDYYDQARLVCAGCTVRTSCLEFALETNQRHGMWGGLVPKERRVLRAQRRRAQGAAS